MTTTEQTAAHAAWERACADPDADAKLTASLDAMHRPTRVRQSRRPGARIGPNARSVAVPTKWANPHRPAVTGDPAANATAVADYINRKLATRPDLVAAAPAELAGWDLACYCAPHLPCHADVLLALANPEHPHHADVLAAIANPRLNAPCLDCGEDTINHRRNTLGGHEYYAVHDTIWRQAMPNYTTPTLHDYLCIGCLETRIGRTLTPNDFTDAPVNQPDPAHSPRLRNRLGHDRCVGRPEPQRTLNT